MYGDNTATKRHQDFHPPQNNHQMVSPGQQGRFDVTRTAPKGEFHGIHDWGGGAGGGGGRGLFFNIFAAFSWIWMIQLAVSSLLVTLTTYYPKDHLILAQTRSNGVDLVHMRSLVASQE